MNSSIKNILRVTISNIVVLISGVLVGFLIPKLMEIESYGYYKTFTLYSTYLSICHLGIIDGIVLKYGGIDYEYLDKKILRSTFNWYVLIHVFFALVFIIIAICVQSTDYRFIIVSLAFEAMFLNVTSFFQQISQITQRFHELSVRKILQSGLNIAITIGLYALNSAGIIVNYKVYVIGVLLINAMLSLWYTLTYKELVIGKKLSLSESIGEVKSNIVAGVPLLIANMCGTLILTIDRQFVNLVFDKSTYAIYSFAYNMLSLVTVATSAIGTVLYPILKRKDKDEMGSMYNTLVSLLLVFIYLGMASYYPLNAFVKWFLPKYADSIPIFRIVFIGLAGSTVITVIIHNYYKSIGNNLKFFVISILALFLSALANVTAYLLFKTTIAISCSSVLTIGIWYFLAEKGLLASFSINPWENRAYIAVMSVLFIITSSIDNILMAFVLYVVLGITVTIMLFGSRIQDYKRIFIKQ